MEKLERLTMPEGVKVVTPPESLRRLKSFLEQVEGLGGLIFIGQEGNTGFFRGLTTRGVPDSLIRESLQVAITRPQMNVGNEPELERLIQIPGMRQLSQREATERVNRMVRSCPGLTLVMVLLPGMRIDRLRRIRSPNLSQEAAVAMLRLALSKFNRSGSPLVAV